MDVVISNCVINLSVDKAAVLTEAAERDESPLLAARRRVERVLDRARGAVSVA